jgi:3-deoxy-D-manno-octulosonic-acid transferase
MIFRVAGRAPQGVKMTDGSWKGFHVPYLLNLLYVLAFLLCSPWLLYKALTTGKYRQGFWSKLSGRAFLRTGDRPCAWFHGVSVGEIHLLKQVVSEFRKRHPSWDCVISTTTDTGYEEARKRFPDLPVFFWPFDFTWAVHRAVQRVRPSLVVLAEGELWPNFIAGAKRQAVPVAIVNGRMSPRSLRRYRRLRWLARGLFRKLDLCAVHTEEYARAFRALGAGNVHVTGSVKYDGACVDRNNPRTRELGRLLGISAEHLVLVAGSTQAPEESIILEIYCRASERHPNLRLVIVPRQKERFDEVADLLRASGVGFARRSELTQACREPIILLDTFGELGAVWGLANVAFVGGSLDGKRGGQNMIEPAAYGAAVAFGPHTWNFKDTVTRLLEHEAAIQAADSVELDREITRLLADANARLRLGQAARQFVFSQQGASQRTLEAVDQLLAGAQSLPRAA